MDSLPARFFKAHDLLRTSAGDCFDR